MDHPCILGIDVASKKLDVCLDQGPDAKTAYSNIEYSDEALNQLLSDNPDINSQVCIVGLESTGDYHLKAAKYFLKKGFDVRIINPILTKQYTRSTIRGIKTDKTDAELICKLVRENEGEKADLVLLEDQDKELLRLYQTLSKTAVSLKLRMASSKRKGLKSKTVLKKMSRIVERIEALNEQIIQEVVTDRSCEEELIDSIPGFSLKLSAVVHHEIGSYRRFPNSKSLVAYAGLDPRIKQSGSRLNTQGRLTKRGSANLRRALFLAANVARNHDAELHEYYLKKRSEGRSHKETLCMISRKLLARIFAVLKEQRPYVRKELLQSN